MTQKKKKIIELSVFSPRASPAVCGSFQGLHTFSAGLGQTGQSIIDPMEWVTLKLLSGADWQVIFVDQHADGTLMSWPVPKSARSSIAP